MSNDSDDLSPAQRMFKRVPGTSFVDLAPEEKVDPHQALAAIVQLQGPLREFSESVDRTLGQFATRIANLERRPRFKSCADFET